MSVHWKYDDKSCVCSTNRHRNRSLSCCCYRHKYRHLCNLGARTWVLAASGSDQDMHKPRRIFSVQDHPGSWYNSRHRRSRSLHCCCYRRKPRLLCNLGARTWVLATSGSDRDTCTAINQTHRDCQNEYAIKNAKNKKPRPVGNTW